MTMMSGGSGRFDGSRPEKQTSSTWRETLLSIAIACHPPTDLLTRAMGCSPSKLPSSASSPTKKRTPNHHPYSVSLSSTTYGALLHLDDLPSTDPLSPPHTAQPPPARPPPMHHVLSSLNHNFDHKADSGPQSWHEVSSMLQNLKPAIDSANPMPGKASAQPDSVDIDDIMRDLDEDSAANGFKSSSRKRNAKPFDKSMPIHTLEELDGCLQDKGDHPEQKKVLTAKANQKGIIGSRTSLNTPLNHKVPAVEPTTSQGEQRQVIPKSNADSSTSLLFDSDFLGSYKQTLDSLSEDDWKAVAVSDHEPKDMHTPPGNIQLRHDAKSGLDKSVLVTGLQQDHERLISSRSDSKAIPTVTEKVNATEIGSSLEDFESICPPDGGDGIVLYTTSLKRIKKTYEDCIKAKFILLGYGVSIDERDVSLHLEYRNELRELLQRVVTVPRLFVRGRYIGGAEQIADLYEQGKLENLIQGHLVN